MSRTKLVVFAAVLAWGPAAPCPAQVQKDRLGRSQPGLVLETGARTAACDQLTFTADGRHLLAAGDDKVVRDWPFAATGLDGHNESTLRWPTWHEQRGSIYALALSPDNQRVAIAGLGARSAAVAVLDRATGKVEQAVTDVRGVSNVIRAVAFSPDGATVAYGPTDGSVWVWHWKSDRKNDTRRLGGTPGQKTRENPRGINVVRSLVFTDAGHVLSVAEEGQVVLWDLKRGGGEMRLHLQNVLLRCAAFSPERRWLAAGTTRSTGHNRILIRSLDGRQAGDVDLGPEEFPRSLAFDARGRRLAVAVGRLVRQPDAFAEETDDEVRVFDLTGEQPQLVVRLGPVYSADALAFHPSRNVLAVAGGDNHEVTAWDLAGRRPVGAPIRGPGSCLWGVGLAGNDRYLGFQDRRVSIPTDANRRGQPTSWRVFDLKLRRFTSASDFHPIESLDTAGGWTVRDTGNRLHWKLVGPDGRAHDLPWNEAQDGLPRCYTFLKPVAGGPVRLVVGHYWGASIFELTDREVRRVRLLTGHQGEVMAVAPSADGRWLVTASRDETVAAWSLDDFQDQPALGASFVARQGRVFVTAVDVGSPAWEVGLVAGDEVVLFQFNVNEFVFDPEGRKTKLPDVHERGGAERCVEVLSRPQPGKQFYFLLRRAGEKQPIETATSVKQRPLWRFFPTRTGEWVLWMWQNYYYDTSTSGDFNIGWVVNPDLRTLYTEPRFYPAEALRNRFHRRDVIDKLLGTRQVKAALQVVKETAPGGVSPFDPLTLSLTVRPAASRGEDPIAQVRIRARGDSPDQQLTRVDLWVNDALLRSWKSPGDNFSARLTIPHTWLRPGRNEVLIQAYDAAGGRTDLPRPEVVEYTPPTPPGKPRLHALLIGIGDYSKARSLPNLPTLKDLASLEPDLQRQKQGDLYAGVDVHVLPDEKATPVAVLGALRTLATQVSPDDRLVVFLSGHGDLLPGSNAFLFCCANYDRARADQTGITARDLYDTLAGVPCHKILFLDACHAGDAVVDTNAARALTPGARGLIVLCACDRSQEALANPKTGSLFTRAVVEALDPARAFSQADRNGDRILEVDELADYVQKRVPELVEAAGSRKAQTPTTFPAEPPPLPLAVR